jgi:hypothetical protein
MGRYGDPVNPQGYQRGIANMAQLLQPGGTFLIFHTHRSRKGGI